MQKGEPMWHPSGGRLLATLAVWLCAICANAQVRISGEAYVGQPFGIARVAVDLPAAQLPEALQGEGLGIREQRGRALYPVVEDPAFAQIAKQLLEGTPLLTGGPVRQEVRGILRGLLDQPPRKQIYFLFTGDGPLQMTLEARDAQPFELRVADNPAAHRKLLQTWWQEYTAPPKFLERKPDYPPVVENYLRATLARRLNLKLPERDQTETPGDLLNREVSLLAGAESVLGAMQQNRLLGLTDLRLPADQPLPEAIDPPPLAVNPPDDVPVEPIAMRVPAECFYVRFGDFNNVLWLQDTLAIWGGDLQNLLTKRGILYDVGARTEQQLVVRQTALARLMGDKVVADVAIIGTDMFLREGGAFGLLFQAKVNLAFSAGLAQQRAEWLARTGAKEEKVKIGDREVSFLFHDDGAVRSYYVADGEYHFVTTSRRLAERFLEASAGKGSLGASAEFRHARQLAPLARGDTVFIYFSDAFFRNLTSPQYRIEMARRLQAHCDVLCVQMAVLVAAAEGKPAKSIQDLIDGALLPAGFGKRPDGSETRLVDGEVFDSVRGRRGSLTPVPDVPVSAVTAAEAREYRRFAEVYREKWGRMDPMLVAIRREPLPERRERIIIDAEVNPFEKLHFDVLSELFGPADDRRIAPVPGNIAEFELLLKKQRLVAGIRDVALPVQLGDARNLHLTRLRDVVVGYLGTTGELGVLDFLARPLVWPPDPRGTPLGLFKRQAGELTVFSLQPEVLGEVVPQLRFEPATRPAQLRALVGDVTRARIARFVNNLGYTRSLDTSLGNLRLLHAVEQQLHVPAANAREAAEYLVGGKLVCPLGGKYEVSQSGGVPRWTSTAMKTSEQRRAVVSIAPDGFVAPPLNWFRGLQLDAAMTEKHVVAHVEVEMQLPK